MAIAKDIEDCIRRQRVAHDSVEFQFAGKDREIEELHRQLDEAQDMERARKQTDVQRGLHPLFITLTVISNIID